MINLIWELFLEIKVNKKINKKIEDKVKINKYLLIELLFWILS